MKKSIIIILSLFISVSAYGASFSIPRGFELLALNGNAISSSAFNKTTRLTFVPGPQKIAVLYKATVRNDIGNGSTRVASAPLIISLLAQENEHYQLLSVSKIKRLSDAEAFIKDPQIKVQNAQGELASYTMHLAKTGDQGILGNLINNKENTTKTVALLETIDKSDRDKKANNAQKMLHHWWSKADLETQKQFASWAIKKVN